MAYTSRKEEPVPRRQAGRAASIRVALLVGAMGAVAALSAVGASAQSQSSVTLTVWGSPGWNDAEKAVLQRFQDTTGIGINLELPKDAQTVLAQWGSGERPDMMFYFADAAHLASLNPAENLQDLSNEPFAAQQLPAIQEAMKFDGKTYAALWQYPYVFGMLYNKQILEELGVEPPTDFAGPAGACETIKEQPSRMSRRSTSAAATCGRSSTS